MVLDEIFRKFMKEGTVALMARVTLERIFTPAKVDAWFARVAQRQYTRDLLFSSVLDVMSLVAFKAFPNVHAAYRKQFDKIGVSVTSVYNKLSAIEPQTSRALVKDTAAELADAVVELKGQRASWIPGYRVKLLDGNCIEATEHRLEVLRKTSAGPLPGKSLVVYDPALEMVIDLFPCEDGHAQERSLLTQVVPTVEARDLWIMDRNFCVRAFLASIEDRGASFACRHHEGLPLTSLGRERKVGATETGTVYEQWVSVTFPETERTAKYRLIRIHLKRKSRDGDWDIWILTNLPKTAADAKLIARLYHHRWKIETMFQELEAHLHSEVNSLGYPKAALFSFCVAVVGYNVFAVVKAALRRVHGEETVEQLSGYYISIEMWQCHMGMSIAIPAKTWTSLRGATQAEFLQLLMSIASEANLYYYRKTSRGPKNPQPERTEHAGKTHVSTARLLRDRNNKKAGD